MWWSLGVQTMGIPYDQFGSLTPREFGVLVERYKEARKRSELPIAMLTTLVANVMRDSNVRRDPFKVSDWQLDRDHADDGVERDPKSGMSLADILRPTKTSSQIFAHLQGIQMLYGKANTDKMREVIVIKDDNGGKGTRSSG